MASPGNPKKAAPRGRAPKPRATSPEPLLRVDGLSVSYATRRGDVPAVRGLSFALEPGESLGLVGESGCGKTTAAFAVMHHLAANGRITGGGVFFGGRRLSGLSPRALRGLRGREMAMVYQDPLSCLNPVLTVGAQLMEGPRVHDGDSHADARRRALAALEEVQLADPEAMLGRYPHQLSGGQQQRVLIAMALICRPGLLVMDEPTSGLDVTIEAAVLELVAGLRARYGLALLFISHDLGTVARVCDRVGVMYAGEMVEQGPIRRVFEKPAHPYTRGLLDCLPTGGRLAPIPGQMPPPAEVPAGCGFAPRCEYARAPCRKPGLALEAVPGSRHHAVLCVRHAELPKWPGARGPARKPRAVPGAASGPPQLEVSELTRSFRTGGAWGGGRPLRALNGVTLAAGRGRTLAIVGESGCGKSTLAKVVTGLEVADGGSVRFEGLEIGTTPVQRRAPAVRRALQMVFQHPDATLNPAHSVGFALSRALRRLGAGGKEGGRASSPLGAGGKGESRRGVEELLALVNLPPELAAARPGRLSGGQAQRVAIARALAGEPALVVADEPVSALDVSVKAAIVNLLQDLQAQRGMTLLFISHDLPLVRHLADRVVVVYLGRVMETGPRDAVFRPPFHPYTEALLAAAVPPAGSRGGGRARPALILEGSPPSAFDPPPGCPFHTRCPRKLGPECEAVPPPMRQGAGEHRIACHIPLKELAAKTGQEG